MKIYYKENGRFVKATGDGIFKESANVNKIQFKLPGVPNNSVVFATFLLPYPEQSDQYGNYSAQSLKLENVVDTEDGGYLWESTIPGGYLVNDGTAYISASIHLADGTTTYTENEQIGNDRTITVGTTTYVITYSGNNLVLTAGSIEFTTNTTTSIIINNKIYLIKGTSTQLQLVAQLKVKTTERVQFIIEESGDYDASAVLPELGEQILYELANQHTDITEINAELELKQDKTDNNLATTSKTVVGAINELKTETDSLDTQINSTDEEHPGINARLTTAEQDIVDINTEQGVQNTNIETNTGNISTLQTKVSNLESIVGSGEDYIGTYPASGTSTLDPNNASNLATLKSQLSSFVISKRGSVQGGDVVIYIQTVAHGTDKNYKFIYSGAITDWTFYEIPATEKAENDTYGIVKGSLGAVNATEVDIVGGEIEEIWVTDNDSTQRRLAEYLNTDDGRIADLESDVSQAKQDITQNTNDIDALETAVGKIEDGTTVVPKADQANKDGLGRNISSTYMTQDSGATKTYVKDYALPREFNDVSFVGAGNKFVSEVPTSTSPLYTVNVSQIGDNTLFYAEKTIQNAEFQLGNKNSYTDTLYVTASINCTVAFRVTTQVYTGSQWVTLNAELTDQIDLTANVIKKVNFGSPFNLLNQILNIQSGDTIKQTFEVVTETSTATTFNVYSNETYASTFYLNTTAQTIYVAQGYMGELPVVNLNGILTSGNLIFTVSNDLIIHDNVSSLFKLNYTDTITSNTPVYLKQGDEKIRIVTPYNYDNNNDATANDLTQTFKNSTSWLFVGIFTQLGGNRVVVVNVEDISKKLDKINTANQIYTTDNSSNQTSVTQATAFNRNFETNTTNIKMNGDVSVGSSTNVARADHVHPKDTSKQDVLTAGSNIQINGTTISATDTTYSSLSASQGGTDVSLVTTGEKYTWNSKQNALPTTTTAGQVLKSTSTAGTVEWASESGAPELYYCTYNSTTLADIAAALSAGKLPVLVSGDNYAYFRRTYNGGYYFVADKDNITSSITTYYIASNGVWGQYGQNPELTANKVTSVSSSSTDTEYPSAKCVYDAVDTVTEIAEGKTKNYVIDDSVTETDVVNTEFAATTDTISIEYTGKKLKQVSGTYVLLSDLKIGDIVCVTQTNVPDRWVGSIETEIPTPTITFYKLETKFTIDATPTNQSTNPVSSGGVYTSLSGKQNSVEIIDLTGGGV